MNDEVDMGDEIVRILRRMDEKEQEDRRQFRIFGVRPRELPGAVWEFFKAAVLLIGFFGAIGIGAYVLSRLGFLKDFDWKWLILFVSIWAVFDRLGDLGRRIDRLSESIRRNH